MQGVIHHPLKVRGSVCADQKGCTSRPGSVAKVIKLLKFMYSPAMKQVRKRAGTGGRSDGLGGSSGGAIGGGGM